MSNETTTADGGVRKKGKLGQRIAYACGNLGQSAFYNAMSTYFHRLCHRLPVLGR